jgi:glycosyl transferase family 25
MLIATKLMVQIEERKPLRAFVISLDDAIGTERMKAMQVQCKTLGIECVKVPGIRGTELKWKDINRAASTTCQWVCTPGMVGCGASHIELWKRVVSENMEYALVLEDDAVLAPSFTEETIHALQIVPKYYHILLLGCFLCDDSTQHIFSRPVTSSAPAGLRSVSQFAGTHAYIISNSGARHLLRKNKGKVSYHIDAQMSSTRGTKIYALDKDVAHQADMKTSSTAVYGFPYSINTLLGSIRTEKNIDLSYYCNTGIARIGPYHASHIVLTPWHIVFVLLGYFHVPWKWVAACSIIDILGPWTVDASPRDVASKMAAFAMGTAARSTYNKISA